MGFTDLLVHEVTITHRTAGGSKGAYGNKTAATTTTSTMGRLSGMNARELGVGTDLAVTARMLYLPPDATIGHRDTLDIDGVPYEVVGEPHVVYDAAAPHHIEVAVNRVDA